MGHARAVRRVLWITLGLNLAVAAAKILAGWRFHVLSLTADGLHSSFDGLNNVIGLIALAFAVRPPDRGHPYGHHKLETFAALGIGISLGVVGAGLVRAALGRFGHGAAPSADPLTFGVTLLTLLVNRGVARYELREGRRLHSDFLLADAQHTSSDVLVSLSVLIALVATRLHQPRIDLIAALVIAGIIAWTAVRLIARNVNVLADAAALDPAEVGRIASTIDGVRACHRVRSRGPEGHVFVDLHIHVDPELPTHRSHALGHEVADALRKQLPGVTDVLVHVEPEGHAPDPRGDLGG